MTTVAGEILVGTTGGSTFYPDQIMDAGFTGLIDFVEDYCRNYSPAYAGGAVATGHTFRDVVDPLGATYATVGADCAGLSTKGLLLDGAGYVQLPDVFKIAAAETHFAVSFVIAADPAAVYTASESGMVLGQLYNNGPTCNYALTYAADANGKLSNVYARTMGLGIAIPASVFADGKSHFVVLDVQVLSAVSPYSIKLTVTIDGVLIGSQTSAGSYVGAFTTSATVLPFIGTPTASSATTGYTKIWRGSVGRGWIKRFGLDPDATINTAAAINAREFAAYGADYV